jgi:hypothetical protein
MQQQPVDLLQVAEAPKASMRWRSATGVLDALEVPADRAAWILIASVVLSQVLTLKTAG